MSEILTNCPICNTDSFKPFLTVKDYSVSKENFDIVSCSKCDFHFTNPRPSSEEIGKYYQSEEYISHTDEVKNLTQFIYKIARKFTLGSKVRLINNYRSDNSLLDVGCGTGDFLNEASKQKWNITGIEVNPDARAIANKKNGNAILATINELPETKKFQVITLWHVLEHVHTLNEYIESLKQKLLPNGTLIIAVPNRDSFDSHFYKQHWAAWDVPRHLYHFNTNTIEKLMQKHGLKVKNIKPMKLDSFYVSLLSEKYQLSKTTLVSAFINGYKSNVKAYKNTNYSSLIYIITH